MPIVAARKKKICRYGPQDNGILMTPREYDRANFVRGWRYELINGILIVVPPPVPSERDPNEELGHLLRRYQETHPLGHSLDATLAEEEITAGGNRRHVDRAIWAGLGRLPRRRETPMITVDFVSAGRRDRERDYLAKKDEYLAVGVKEYWIIDRFQRTMTVYTRRGRRRVIREDQTCRTDLLPGFELPLARLFALADRWPEETEQD
jgi:Uma2 family endonuclease